MQNILEITINNWFTSDNEVEYAPIQHEKTKFYCANCTRHFDLKFRKYIFDARNRKVTRCLTCYLGMIKAKKNV